MRTPVLFPVRDLGDTVKPTVGAPAAALTRANAIRMSLYGCVLFPRGELYLYICLSFV